MPGDSSHLAGTAEEADARIAVIAALGFEKAPLELLLRAGTNPRISLYQSGVGFARAYAAVQAALEAGATAVVSWGVAGGLEPGLKAGTLLLPRRVVTFAGEPRTTDPGWRANLVGALRASFEIHEGDLLCVEEILSTPRAKARAAMASGAAGADMESAAVAEAAWRAGKPFVALRVVADGLTDKLPPGVVRWMDDAGNQRLAPALHAALRPAGWRDLLMLTNRYLKARRALVRSAHIVAPQGFLLPGTIPPQKR